MNNIYNVMDSLYNLGSRVANLELTLSDVGDYKISARNDDFNGWLLCDGRSLSRSTYPKLYNVLGSQFGSNDSLTFNLPDFRGRVIGAPGMGIGLTNRSMGDSTGSERHLLTVNELPSHAHTGTTVSSGSHVHTATASGEGGHNHGGSTSIAGAHSHTTNSTGNPYGLATMDGTATATETDSTANEIKLYTTPVALSVDTAGDHSHTINTDGTHSHVINVAVAGTHTHTFTTDNVGSNVAFPVMQPTLFGTNVFIYSAR